MSTSGASFLIELSSATATKTGAPREARYQLQLNPGINIPFLAEPKAQLEALKLYGPCVSINIPVK